MAMSLPIAMRGRPNKETAVCNERWHFCRINDCTNSVHPDFVYCIACRQILGRQRVAWANFKWQSYINDAIEGKEDLFLYEKAVEEANRFMQDWRKMRWAQLMAGVAA
jgi:hypothetical protein